MNSLQETVDDFVNKKTASSKLMKRLGIVGEDIVITPKDIPRKVKVNNGIEFKDYAHLAESINQRTAFSPEVIGRIEKTKTMNGSPVINWMQLLGEYQGMGLSKKIYGELMRKAPTHRLYSDSLQSEKGLGIYKGMAKHPHYDVKFNPSLYKGGPERFPNSSIFGRNARVQLLMNGTKPKKTPLLGVGLNKLISEVSPSLNKSRLGKHIALANYDIDKDLRKKIGDGVWRIKSRR